MFNNKKSAASKAAIDWQQGLQPASEILSLEQRIMLDAAAPASVDAVNDSLNADAEVAQANDSEPALTEATITSAKRQELVFVDSSIEGYDDLLADIFAVSEEIYWQPASANDVAATTVVSDDRVITIYAIDGNEQGFSAVTGILGNKDSVDAIHILSHGTTAGVKMGAETIADESLSSYADQLSVWGDALANDGDILLYGCNVAAGGAGVDFVQSFARITNADVAASDDYTGAEQYGGDWTLEVATGAVETELVVGKLAAATFDAVLVEEVPVPTATLTVPADNFLGESFSFSATFDNTVTDTDSLGDVGVGYAPYLSVFVEPGVSVDSADYLGSAVDLDNAFTWDAANGQWLDASSSAITEHPFGPASDFALPADPGVDATLWYLIELPFASFTHNQPPADVNFSATLASADGATVGAPLAISAQGGFRYGADPQNNPASDAPLLQSSAASATITPLLMAITTTVDGAGNNSANAENEAATGANDPITWQINVDIAAGETVENIVITDLVPNDFFYTGNLTVSGAASGSFVNLGSVDASTGAVNDNQFSVSFDSVTGTTAGNDIVITYTGYIPELDANGAPILDPTNAALQSDIAAGQIENNVQIEADYDNGSGLAAVPTATASEIVTPQAIAIQKDVVNIVDANAVGNSPGDTLQWTLRVQVSDYFSMDNFVVTDIFSDGQLLDNDFTPTYRVVENGVDSGVHSFAGRNYTLNAIDSTTGLTTLDFRLSDQLGGDGVLDGDAAADAGGDGRTTVEIIFRSVVQENFQYPAYLSGDASVDVSDLLSNNVSVSAEIAGTDNAVNDDSGASVQVVGPSQSKEIYAINGDTEFTDAELTPGSQVTYRITVTLPSVDIENLSIVDFLPLPVFDVNAPLTYGGQFSGSDNVPVAGQYGFGPLTNSADFPAGYFNGASPDFGVSVTADSGANSMTFDFDSIDVDNSTGGVIDLLFTMTAVDAAFADGLQLTNQATVGNTNSNNQQPAATSIVQIELLAPELDITKGIVAVDSSSNGSFDTPLPSTGITFNDAATGGTPFSGGTISSAAIGAEPLTADLIDVDAGDVVRFALVIENSGGADAFDIAIRDALPAGYAYAGNLAVTLGDGTAVDISAINATDLFTGAGITLPDAAANGLAGAGRDDATLSNNGSNIIVVTYDASLQSSVIAQDLLTSTAEILAFAGFEGGSDYTAGDSDPQWQDSADTTLLPASVTREIVGSGIIDVDNGLRDAVVGEYVQYELQIAVPEGEMALAEILDNLDPGLVFVSLDSVTPSSGDVSSGAVTAPVAGATGTLAFNLGTVTNTNIDNASAETLTLRYTARVANDGNAADAVELNSDSELRWDVDRNGNNSDAVDGKVTDSDGSVANHRVTVLEPELAVTQVITTRAADEGDPIVYQITIDHADISSASAYDVTFNDVVPAGISVSGITVTHSSAGDIGPTGSNVFQLSGNTVATGAGLSFDLLAAESVVITVTGTLDNASAGAAISNSASVHWSSLDADAASDGDEADERGGDSAGLADGSDSYTTTTTKTFRVSAAEVIKRVLNSSIDDANNGNLEAVVGEYITYELVVTVPEAAMPVTEIIDTLDAGLVFVSLDSVTPTSGVTTAAVVAPAAGTTGALTFDLGTVDNSNSDNAVDDTVTLQYTVRVADDASNAINNTSLGNQVELRWDSNSNGNNSGVNDGSVGDSDGTPNNGVTILEPVLETVKTITTTPADAGDAVSYQVLVRHIAGTSTTTAYDVTFSDAVPAGISVAGYSVNHSTLGDVSADFELAGNTLQSVAGSSVDLLETETLTITITGAVTDINAGETVSNTASINWTSLDSATLDDGDDANERDGSSGYADTSVAASFTADSVTLTKEIVSTSIVNADNGNLEATIGEYVNYRIVVTLPEGDAPIAELIDSLAAGLVFDTANGITVTPSSTDITTDLAVGFANASAVVDGQNITIDLGNISNTNRNDGAAETLTIEYRAFVGNDSSAQPAGVFRGDTIGNSVQFRWDSDSDGNNIDGSASDSDGDSANAITVVEAELEAVNTIITTPADGGDPVSYQILVQHSGASNSSAYDVTFADLVDAGITITSVSASHSTDGLIGPGGTGVIEIAGNSVQTAAGQSFDLLEGETLTITINGTVSGATAGHTVGNSATVNWSSLDAESVNDGNESVERGGDGSGRADGTDAYIDTSATVDFTVSSATITKRVIATGLNTADNDNSEAVVGEFVQYEVVVVVPEADLPLAEIIDPLEAGLEFVSLDSITSSNVAQLTTDLAGGFAAVSGPAAGAAGEFSLNLGNVSNTNSDDSSVETLTIRYTVRIANDLGAATAGAVLGNTVELRWDANNSGGNVDTGDGSETDSDGNSANNEVTVLEPELAVTQVITTTPADEGDPIVYQITIDHTDVSSASAYDVTFSDVVPAGIGVSGITVAHSSAGDIGPTGSNVVQLSGDTVATGAGLSFDLLAAESVVITISGTLDSAITGAVISNSASVHWSSLDADAANDGDEADERGGDSAGLADGSDGYTTTTTKTFRVSAAEVIKRVLSSSIIDANNGTLQAVVGEYITYELVVTVPEAAMPVTEIIDTLDAGLVFVSLDSVTPTSGVTTAAVVAPAAGTTGALTFDLGTVDNTNSDNAVDDTVTLQYTVRVADDASNAINNTSLGNQVELRWDSNSNTSNSDASDGSVGDSDAAPDNGVTILEPMLEAVKTITTTPTDAGDAVSYQVLVRHIAGTSTTTAYDVTFSDAVPAGISVTGFSVNHSTLGNVSGDFELAGNTLQSVAGSSVDLLETETLTITINGVVTDINAGETVSNTASINWTSLDSATLDGDDANERDGSSGYADTSVAANFTADSVTLTKEIVSTSNDDNGNLEATIGEYVNYRIVVTLPEGDAPVAQLIDSLAAGLVFDAANGITVTPSSTAITTDLAVGFANASAAVVGQDISVDLGNIRNTNTNDGVAETLTIEYRAYVGNDSSAQPAGVFRGDTPGNSVGFRWDSDGDGNNNDGSASDSDGDAANAITVVEAELEAVKSITTTPSDQGDAVVYQIILGHTDASNSSAYDVTFGDLVDTGITITSVSASHSSTGLIGPGVIEIVDNNVQTAAGQSFDLLEGETLTITINGTVSDATAGGTVGNSATVNWSSLDAANVSDGNETAERGGDGSGRADGTDGYIDTSATVDFTVSSATIIKRVITTGLNTAGNDDSEAVVGEFVQYEVVVVVPEANLPLAEIIDPLQAGLEFVSLDSITSSNVAELTTDLVGGFATVSAPAAGTAGAFSLNLGNVSNSNSDNSSAETLTILYTARIANDLGVTTAGAVLGNTVELRWDANISGGNVDPGDGSVTDNDGSSANNEVTVLEPVVTMVKTVTESAPFLGETITYTLTLSNQNVANGSDAFDLNVADTLPEGMTLDVGSIRVDGLSSAANTNIVTDSSSGNTVDLVLRELAFDATITLTYAATVSVLPADFSANLDSTATVNWSSLDAGNAIDGSESSERGGDAAGQGDGSDGYTAGDNAPVMLTAFDLEVSKDDAGVTVTANGAVVYSIDFANNGTRAASGVVITETLPAGARFDLANSSAGWVDQGAGVYTFAVGTVAAGGNGSVNFAVTADATFAAGQDALANSVTIAADSSNGTDLDPADNTATDTTPVIAVPDLSIGKDDAGITVLPNGTVVYTLTYANNGLQGASGVVITETVPTGSSFDAANSTPGWSETAPASGVFTFALGGLVAGGAGSVDFAVGADATFVAGQDQLANSATIADDGSNGADANPTDNTALDTTPVDAAPDYRVIKSSDNGSADLVPGQMITYSISVFNDGAQDGSGVVVSDSWVSSVFEDPATISNAGTYNSGTDEITWNIGSLAAGSSIDLTVSAMVRSTLTATIDSVTNSVAATDDTSNGADVTPSNNSDSVTDSIDAALPDYRIIKSSDNTGPLSVGQVVTYSLQVFNDGNQDGTGIVIRDDFPTDVFAAPSDISNGGVFDPLSGEIIWNFADLAAGDSLTLTVTATLAAVIPAGFDDVVNTASVSDDGSNGPDVVDNNTSTDTDIIAAAPDYFVSVSNSNIEELEIGETVSYSVDYGNLGTQDGSNVVVTLDIPAGVFLTPASISGGGIYDAATGSIGWNLDNLAGGDSGQFRFNATVTNAVAAGFDAAQVLANITDDGLNGEDLNPVDNSDSITDPVSAAPNYVVDKDDGIDFIPRNLNFTYRINVTNSGTQDGTGVIVTDTFPADVMAIINADGGTVDLDAGTITWHIATLAVGEAQQFDVVVQMLPTAVLDNADQSFNNTVSVTDDNVNGADLNLADNNAVATTQMLGDVGDLDFFLDDARNGLHFGGEYPREFEYTAYPRWLHGRLVSLETMQVAANLVAARTEVELDSAFGLWSHSFYPSPWNQQRGDSLETQESHAHYSLWAEPRPNQASTEANVVDRITLYSSTVDFADLEQQPNKAQQDAQLQLFKRAVQHENSAPPSDTSGTRQFEQAASTLRAETVAELVAAFRESSQ